MGTVAVVAVVAAVVGWLVCALVRLIHAAMLARVAAEAHDVLLTRTVFIYLTVCGGVVIGAAALLGTTLLGVGVSC